jgi:molecular chaperone DnaK (HSP70)
MVMDEKEHRKPRYIIGVDLGTTNISVSYVDTETSPVQIKDFFVKQIIAPGEIDTQQLYPSFYYDAAESEFAEASLAMPWDKSEKKFVTGIFAREHGTKVPGRMVSSAKSWLSHAGVDRTAPLLPWHAVEDVEKISPVTASSKYLSHLREAWNHIYPEYPFEEQDIIITVPASFDEVARELTVEAASQAEMKRIVLLEEPQAAFYAWIQVHARDWHNKVQPGQTILICDIGGGTTDFTMIQVRGNSDGTVQFYRIAVGDHLILGGDNIDLALAYHVEQVKLKNIKLTPRQFGTLVGVCRKTKEIMFSDEAPAKYTISIPGSGSSLVGGSIQVELDRDEVEKVLLDGFFPFTSINEVPVRRQSGFQEFGLPYASDAAVTRYLASFLTSHRNIAAQFSQNKQGDPSRPDFVLFNGGVLASSKIRRRMLDVLRSWYSSSDTSWEPIVFENKSPELAVSQGAAYYGLVRRGNGVRINAGLARSYYIGVETDKGMQAFCLAPAGLQEGEHVDLKDRHFALLIRQPVEFPLFVSSRRSTDKPGDLVDPDPLEMYTLPPIRTVLRSGRKLEADTAQVILNVKLTEIGTLDLWCSETAGNREWKLQFDVRSATRTDITAHKAEGEAEGVVDSEMVERCRALIVDTFQRRDTDSLTPQNLVKNLETATEADRMQWPPSLLRAFWEIILEQQSCRSVDPVYEARWLNLLGFSLRPGYGYAIDDWRIKQTWLLFQKGVVNQKNQSCAAEWWVLWRRIAGGLNAGQQQALAIPLIAAFRSIFRDVDTKRKQKSKNEIKYGIQEQCEIWRLLGSLEYLKSAQKEELGTLAIQKIISKGDVVADAAVWAIGRFGARIPMYGPLNELVSQEAAGRWAQFIIDKAKPNATSFLALMQLCRKCNDRYRDIDDTTRENVVTSMRQHKAAHHFIELITSGGMLDDEEKSSVFGEQLPRGLKVQIQT